MNWARLRTAPWLDTRAQFVAAAPPGASLLDLGTADGETLLHFAELRPDLQLRAVDLAAAPANLPPGCEFVRANLERDRLPWADGSLDRITCLHLVEHLNNPGPLIAEVARLLKPGGSVYFETPHPRTLNLPSPTGAAAGTFTMNFFDDLTHTQIVPAGALAKRLEAAGLRVLDSGTSRNWLFAASWPLLRFAAASRKKFTAQAHWIGWSAFVIGGKPG